MAEPCLKVLKVFFTAKQNIKLFSSSAKLSRKAWQWCGNGNFHGMLVSTKVLQIFRNSYHTNRFYAYLRISFFHKNIALKETKIASLPYLP